MTPHVEDLLLEERSMPAAVETERSILGAVQMSPSAMAQLAASLRPGDFYLPAHRKLFAAMLELYAAGRPVDYLTIQNHLGTDISSVGGVAYVSSLADNMPRRSEIGSWCEDVRQRARERAVIEACETAKGRMLVRGLSAEDCIGDLQERLLGIASDSPDNPIESAEVFADRWFGKFRKQMKGEAAIPTFTTGVECLDAATNGGIRETEMWTIGGRQGDGKSVLGLQCAVANILKGIRVFVVSPEMTKDVIMERAIAQLSGVPAWKFRNHNMITPSEEEDIAEATLRIKKAPFWVDDSSSISPQQLSARVRLAKARHGCQLCVVDYLQLILGSGRDRREQVIGISNTLRDLSKTVMPIVALSQLSRPNGKNLNQPPTKHDLMESGSIESDSSTVVLLYRRVDDFNHPTGDDYLIVAKQRHGVQGTEDVMFCKKTLTYRPCTTDEKRDRQIRLQGALR